jgi:hypothetical protein
MGLRCHWEVGRVNHSTVWSPSKILFLSDQSVQRLVGKPRSRAFQNRLRKCVRPTDEPSPPRRTPLTRPRRVQPRPQNVPWSAIEGGAAHIGSTALVSRAAGSGRAHRMARPAPHHKGGALDTRGKIYSLPTKEPR